MLFYYIYITKSKCNMETVNLNGKDYPVMILELIVDLHTKQTAQINLLLDFLSAVTNKSHQELMDSISVREQAARKDVLSRLYSEYGDLPDEVKDWLSPK